MFAIPSAAECVQRARAAFRSFLPGTDGWVWPNNIGPTAKVIGGSASEIYQRLDYVGRQAFVLFAEGKYLEAHGADYGIARRPATPASGSLTVTTTDGLAVAAGAQLQRSDGVIVVAAAAASVTGAGTLSVPVIAATAARATNSQPGTPFTVLSGFSGPGASTATVVADEAGLTGGLDVEPDGLPKTTDLGTLRGRILFRKRNPPHGGNAADYVQWAATIPGVSRVFVERRFDGPGTVRVYPLFDDLFAAAGGVADDAHIGLVRDYIATVQPATAQVIVSAPAPQLVPITIQGITPETTAVETAIQDELADTFRQLGQVAGSDTPIAAMPYLATPFSFAALWVDQAVANATGNKRAIVLAPTEDVAVPAGSVPIFSATSGLNIL